MKFSSIILFLITSILFADLYGQSNILPSGGNISGSGGTVSYSTGQVLYQTSTGYGISIAEGVQQPYVISIATQTQGTDGIGLTMNTYPNPATDVLILKIEDTELSGLSFRLSDATGKLLQHDQLLQNTTKIRLQDLSPATYFVKVIRNNQEIKTFQIIKK